MRTLTALIAIFLAATFAAGQPPALDEREAKKLCEEYVAAATTEARRTTIVARLKTGAPTLCQKALKPMISEEAKRQLALDVAIALRVPGLWSDAKKHLDSSDEDKVVKYGLTSGDKAVESDLFIRWKGAAADSASHGYLQTGFETFPVTLDTIKKFKDFAADKKSDEVRKEGAFKVLQFQFGTDADGAGILANWSQLETAYKIDAKEFPIKNRDLRSEEHTSE